MSEAKENRRKKRDDFRYRHVRSEVYRAWVDADRPRPYMDEVQVSQNFSFYAFSRAVILLSFIVGTVWSILAPLQKAEASAKDTAENAMQNALILQGFITPTPGLDQLVLTKQAELMPSQTPTSTPEPTVGITITGTPTSTPQATETAIVPLHDGYGMQTIKCIDCAVYEIPVRITNYWPDTPATEAEIEAGRAAQKFGNDDLITTFNCWKYSISRGACVSMLETELPWRSFIGWAAACPYDWPDGTVLHIPALGRSFWCLDRGTMVCAGGVCDVDILSPELPQNGGVFTAIVEIPGW